MRSASDPKFIGLVLYALAAGVALVALFFLARGLLSALRILGRLIERLFRAISAAFRGGLFAAGAWVFIIVACALGAGFWLGYVYWFKAGKLDLLAIRPAVCAEILDRNDNPLDYACPFDGVRLWRPLSAISPNLRRIVVFLEDAKFYGHNGFDLEEIKNSIQKDWEKKRLARGGSTITQQLAKNIFLTKQKSFIRKATEIPLAMRLEQDLSKDQILELYLNTIEWGHGIYGAEAAARLYFDHPASSLLDEEAWLLALMIPNPKELNLWVAPRARRSILKRARQLSERLAAEHQLTQEQAREALAKFEAFTNQWATRAPLGTWAARVYPARWWLGSPDAIAPLLERSRENRVWLRRCEGGRLRVNLDQRLQAELAGFLPPGSGNALSAKPAREVVVWLEGKQVRALLPRHKGMDLDVISKAGERLGVKTELVAPERLPASSVWKN